ncbi:hypothetical protein HOK68_00720 [Candidatus Woesearchaeota archaeon]|jgi:hypothetical protein|nr:hypothetical protein [Candidatus Woesearchaeota archaeon]MBT4387038.1 hypothetical protein [Candidatus Woesearchaeota archaeon]MBT4595912.1 hypothetical protein [Candidatus Woesearchaeota archaeon]MBT5741042.1 hypothetical protein [Candidatus Woesearchaeota archaeon]MBT6505283.1 hypothetical protein [Candidatus Woesearchaeota archaeon]
MKCKICNSAINTTFLNKIIGTHVKDKDGHKHLVCFECQSEYSKKFDELKLKLSDN